MMMIRLYFLSCAVLSSFYASLIKSCSRLKPLGCFLIIVVTVKV
jgi:hypothetical protein